MKKAVWSAAAAAAILIFSTSAYAQTTLASQNVTATVTVSNLARLTVGGPVTFPDTDPDVSATITAAPIAITAKARVAAAAVINLTVQAGASHFDSPGTTIPVTGLTWTTSGAPFINGTMSSAAAQTVGSWTGPSNQTGTQTYTLANLWSYAPGTHSVTLAYTLSTP
jgi:hypothetical protein